LSKIFKLEVRSGSNQPLAGYGAVWVRPAGAGTTTPGQPYVWAHGFNAAVGFSRDVSTIPDGIYDVDVAVYAEPKNYTTQVTGVFQALNVPFNNNVAMTLALPDNPANVETVDFGGMNPPTPAGGETTQPPTVIQRTIQNVKTAAAKFPVWILVLIPLVTLGFIFGPKLFRKLKRKKAA
jgi:hypothetical protein